MLNIREPLTLDFRDLAIRTIDWNLFATLGEHDYSEEKIELQHSLVREEILELHEAYENNDDVEMLDAICDIIFVSVYALFLSDLWEEVDTEKFILTQDDVEIDYENVCMGDIITQFDTFLEDREYGGIFALALMTGLVFEIDLIGAYKEVVNSNYSKFPRAEDVDIGDQIMRIEWDGRYKEVTYEEYNGRLIFRCDNGDGKIVKPETFREPELEEYIGV